MSVPEAILVGCLAGVLLLVGLELGDIHGWARTAATVATLVIVFFAVQTPRDRR